VSLSIVFAYHACSIFHHVFKQVKRTTSLILLKVAGIKFYHFEWKHFIKHSKQQEIVSITQVQELHGWGKVTNF